jgi:hypothetical protein
MALKMSLLATCAGSAAALTMGARPMRNFGRTSSPAMSFFDYESKTIGGEPMKMDAFKGKPALILNVASL